MKPKDCDCPRCYRNHWLVMFLLALGFTFIVAIAVKAEKPGTLYYLTAQPTPEQWSHLTAEGTPPFAVCESAERRDFELARDEANEKLISAQREHIAAVEFERDLLRTQLNDALKRADDAVAAKEDADLKAVKFTKPKGRLTYFLGGCAAGSVVTATLLESTR